MHPIHLTPFDLTRQGWAPEIAAELEPSDIVITLEGGRRLQLYDVDRVRTMEKETEALDRSQDYVDDLCERAAEDEEKHRLVEEERQRAQQEELDRRLAEQQRADRLAKQVIVDVRALRKQAGTNGENTKRRSEHPQPEGEPFNKR